MSDADRWLIQAAQLRYLADELEARAAEERPIRAHLDHGRTFDALSAHAAEGWILEPDGEPAVFCAYCDCLVHKSDRSHQMLDQCCDQTPGERCANIDHVIPVSRGGVNDPANLALSCARCNRDKGARTPLEWALDEMVAEARSAFGAVERDGRLLETPHAASVLFSWTQELVRCVAMHRLGMTGRAPGSSVVRSNDGSFSPVPLEALLYCEGV